MFDWTTRASATSTASADAVWRLWTATDGWSRWDAGLEWCRLDGPFAVGTRGVLRPAGGPRVRFRLTRVEPGVGFADLTRLPLTTLEFQHRVEALSGGGVRITHEARIRGLLTPLLSRTLGRELETGMPETVRALAALAAEAGGAAA
jgi:uncharacterized protein YndB with AHSA1/START domain